MAGLNNAAKLCQLLRSLADEIEQCGLKAGKEPYISIERIIMRDHDSESSADDNWLHYRHTGEVKVRLKWELNT